tara:strand:- start:2151 stop:2612 length:462 start_codon:yes stop_codon:yes gene_type:complete
MKAKFVPFLIILISPILVSCSEETQIEDPIFFEVDILEEMEEYANILTDGFLHTTIYIISGEKEGYKGKFPHISPDEIEISAGEAITFVNTDTISHQLILLYKIPQNSNTEIEPFQKNHIPAGENITIIFEYPGEVVIDALWARDIEGKITIS